MNTNNTCLLLRCASYIILFIVLGSGLTPVAQAQTGTPWVEAARQRSIALATAIIEYKETDSYATGAINLVAADATRRPAPAVDTTVTSVSRVELQGDRVRSDSHKPVWNGVTFLPRDCTIIKSSSGTRGVFPNFAGKHGDVQAIVYKKARVDSLDAVSLIPLTLHLRGENSAICPLDLAAFQSTGRKTTIDSAVCNEYRASTSDSVTSIWLDSNTAYSLRRLTHERDQQLLFDIQVQVVADPTTTSRPFRWITKQYRPDGTVMSTCTTEIVAYQADAAVDADRFDVTFPVSAKVYDQRTNANYIVSPNGDWEPMISQRQPAKVLDNTWKYLWLAAVLGIATPSLFVLRFLRRQHRRS